MVKERRAVQEPVTPAAPKLFLCLEWVDVSSLTAGIRYEAWGCLAYQRMSWEALKKSINGLINKVNISNIGIIIQELLQENIVRGRGLLSRSVLQAQSASPIFTHVYAALVAIINSKFPQIGELILKRLILNFRKGYRRNDKAHEVLCLEMLTLLLERPTDDSVEVAIGFLKECGLKLTQVSPRGINAIFERLRNILHESEIDKRVQYMIEVMFAVRKDGFKDHPVILEGLDLVEEDDQFTHMLPLEDEYNPEDVLNVFKMDPNFMENEEKYKAIKKGQKVTIHDKTEINLVSFRRTIYLAIQSRTLQPFFEGLLPRDNPRNTRFAINFFTSIGLGGLTSDSSSESSSEESDSSSTSSQSSASAKDTRKKGHGNPRSKEVDKLIRKQQINDRKQEERRPEQRHQESRTERERRSEKPRDRDSRDPVTKYTSDRGAPSERNSYSRVMNDRDQEMHVDLEHKHGEPKKKRGERRNSFSENEHRHQNKDSEHFRRKDRSKSREKNKKHSGSRSDEDRYQNGAERRWEKPSRYSEQSRVYKKNQDRRREKSPTKQKK
ncbi:pre-mRNA-splicing factor CWC22 isoform 2-like protein [Camelus ferus]|nr:pre-mRNA-splicing factor CWC22 isoform 2-like protein [Camelus ferus]